MQLVRKCRRGNSTDHDRLGGLSVVARGVVLIALICAGCSDSANLALTQVSANQLVVPMAASAGGPLDAGPSTGSVAGYVATAPAHVGPDRSLPTRITAAIALERVTGRKPDPGRLAESN